MKEYRNRLSEQAGALDPVSQGLFCLFGAERLRACCWAYQACGMGDLVVGLETLEQAFGWVRLDDDPRRHQVESVYALVEDVVPRQGSHLAVQAQAGMVALLAGLDLLASRGRATPVDASNFMVDAVDNFQAFSRLRITGTRVDPPDRSDLLERELDAQQRNLAFLRAWSDRDMGELGEHRILNADFAVPVAI